MIQFQEKPQKIEGRKDGRKDGYKDGQILFHTTLLATARGPKKATNSL